MGWSWWNPCCWIGYCNEPQKFLDKWATTSEFITETCTILTLIVVLRILAKLEYMFPLHSVADDSVGTGEGRIDDDDSPQRQSPQNPPNEPTAGGWLPAGTATIIQDLILHQMRRGDEAPAGIGPLQLETVMRILDLSYKVELDATTEVFFTDGEGGEPLLSGSRACLDFVRKVTLEDTGRDWDIPPEMEVPAHFLLALLKGEFPAFVSLYQKGFWKNGQEFYRGQLKDPYELFFAGRLTKAEILAEIEMSLKALDASLGDKQFLIGNQMSIVDGFAFGVLAQMNWTSDQELLIAIQKFPRLVTATNVLCEQLWSDWNPPPDDLEIVQIFPRSSQRFERPASLHSTSSEDDDANTSSASRARAPTARNVRSTNKRPPAIPA